MMSWARSVIAAVEPWTIPILVIGAGIAAFILDDDMDEPPPTIGMKVFRMQKCPFPVPDGRIVECFRVQMPSDQITGRGTAVTLTAAVFRASAATVAAEPIVYLEGGPGGDAGLQPDTVQFWWNVIDANPWLARRDLVVFAQRGAKPSLPSLHCDEAWAQTRYRLAVGHVSRPTSFRTSVDASYIRCLNNLHWHHVELRTYSTRQAALDAARLPRLLGYERWDLWAVSYGTRVALDVLRVAPERVRSVVLDSVFPLDVTNWEESETARKDFLGTVIAMCATNNACPIAYGSWQDGFGRLAARLDSERVMVDVESEDGLDSTRVLFDGATMRETIDLAVYDSSLIPKIPFALAAAEAGDLAPLDPMIRGFVGNTRFGDSSLILKLVFSCSEMVLKDPGTRPSLLGRLLWWRSSESAAGLCEDLDIDAVDDEFIQPVASDVPVLLLAGELDWVTPPAWAERVARTLPNGHVVRFPGLGHGVTFVNDCASTTIGDFVNDPTGWTVPSCIGDLPPPFVPGPD